MKNTDQVWEYFGKHDPYFGVVTWERYRIGNLTEGSVQEFMASGKQHVDYVFKTVHEHIDRAFRPTRALEFGCGVGRVLVPLAQVCDAVVGVDVSPSMLEEARKQCRARGITNAELVVSDDRLSKVSGPFDFLHSLSVFQHIPPRRGERMLRRLIDLLSDGGVGVVHVVYATRWSLRQKLLIGVYDHVPLALGFRNLLKGKRLREPLMQMNAYDLNYLARLLQEHGCARLHADFTWHGAFGVTVFFQKRSPIQPLV